METKIATSAQRSGPGLRVVPRIANTKAAEVAATTSTATSAPVSEAGWPPTDGGNTSSSATIDAATIAPTTAEVTSAADWTRRRCCASTPCGQFDGQGAQAAPT